MAVVAIGGALSITKVSKFLKATDGGMLEF